MFLLIKDVWNWLTNQALHQLFVLLLTFLICFLVLLKYPIEFERTSYESRQSIQITKTIKYVAHTELTGKGAKLQLQTSTYYVEVNKDG